MPDDQLREMSLRGHASATLSHTPESWTDALVGFIRAFCDRN